jgi:hypothetical protein
VVSLLDGRHTVRLEVAKPQRNAYNGTDVRYAAPVRVVCSVQPLRAEEASALGVTPDTAYRVIARKWLGGPYSRVTFNGRPFFQHGETLHHTMSPRTAHDTAVILAQTAKVQ